MSKPINTTSPLHANTSHGTTLNHLSLALGRLHRPSLRAPDAPPKSWLAIWLLLTLIGVALEYQGVELAILYGVHGSVGYLLYFGVLLTMGITPFLVYASRLNLYIALDTDDSMKRRYYLQRAKRYYWGYLALHFFTVCLTLTNALLFAQGYDGEPEVLLKVSALYCLACLLHFSIGPVLAALVYQLVTFVQQQRTIDPESEINEEPSYQVTMPTNVELIAYGSGGVQLKAGANASLTIPANVPYQDLKTVARRQKTTRASNAVIIAGCRLAARICQ